MRVKVTNYKAILKILGIIIFIIGIAEVIPWIYAEVTADVASAFGFRICAPITIVIGF